MPLSSAPLHLNTGSKPQPAVSTPAVPSAATKDLYRSHADRLGCTIPQLLHQLHSTQLYTPPTHANQDKYEPTTHSSFTKHPSPTTDIPTTSQFHDFQSQSIIRNQQLHQLKEDVQQQLIGYQHQCTVGLEKTVDGWIQSYKERHDGDLVDVEHVEAAIVEAPSASRATVSRPSTTNAARPKTSNRGSSSSKGRPKSSTVIKAAPMLEPGRSPLSPVATNHSMAASTTTAGQRQSAGQLALEQILQRAKQQVAQQHSSPLTISHLIQSSAPATHPTARPVTAFIRRPNSYDDKGMTRIHDRLQEAGFATDLSVIQRALHPTSTTSSTSAPRLQRPMTAPLTLRQHPFLNRPVEEQPKKKTKKKGKKGSKPTSAAAPKR